MRHNQPSGWIEITTTVDHTSDRATLLVETGGPILDDEQTKQLAQPFRRLGADRTGPHSGTGLGLSIVNAIATAHSGTLHLQARPKGGLAASIDLPLAAQPAGSGATI